jgi:type VI protein secretion system component Hcp
MKGVAVKRSRIIQVGLLVLVALVASAVVAALAFGRSTAPGGNPGPPPPPSSPPSGQLTITDTPNPNITISVASFSWGISNPTTITGSGISAGKASLSSLNLLGPLDASFPILNEAVATATKFPSAVLTFTASNGTVTYQLNNVVIESEQQSGSGSDATASISLAFEQVHWTFTDASGTTTRGWDVVHNLPLT